jgi:hypothetical protein
MQLQPITRRTGLFLAAAILLPGILRAAVAPNGGSATLATAPSPTPAVCPKAIFADDALGGKDPFFPDSQRRRPQVQIAPVNTGTPSSGAWGLLQLKGISRDKDRKLALINNATLAEGEKAPVRLNNGQSIMIQCLEIRERAVLISIEGVKEAREIRFAREF